MVLGFFFNLPSMNFSFIAWRIADLIHNSWKCHHALIAYWWELTGVGNRENYVNYANMLCYLDHLTSVFYLYLVANCKAFFNSLRFSFLFVNCVIHLLVLPPPCATSCPAICGANYLTFVFLYKE